MIYVLGFECLQTLDANHAHWVRESLSIQFTHFNLNVIAKWSMTLIAANILPFPKKNRLYCVLSPKTMQLMYKSEVLWMNLIQCIDSIYSQTMNHECLKSRRKNWQQRRWPGRFGNTGAGANILMGSNSTFYSSKIRQITRGRLYGEHFFDFFPSITLSFLDLFDLMSDFYSIVLSTCARPLRIERSV